MGINSFNSFKENYNKKFPTSSIIILEEVGNNLIVESEFGKCKIRKQHLMNGVFPTINTAINKTQYFINKANKIHNFSYSYFSSKYTRAHEKVNITCNLHGDFYQEANAHLTGQGCPKCKNLSISLHHSNNPTGWTKTNWNKNSVFSKNFDSFKVYIIKCWNDVEEFYKIGRTFVTIKKRFQSKKEMPYNYNIIKVIEGNCEDMFNLETSLKKMNKNEKYNPLIKFNGSKECFKNIIHIW